MRLQGLSMRENTNNKGCASIYRTYRPVLPKRQKTDLLGCLERVLTAIAYRVSLLGIVSHIQENIESKIGKLNFI